MPQFVMVINGVTTEQLEKILAIQTRSENKIRFVPQGGNQQAAPYQVGSGALQQNMSQSGNPPKTFVNYNFVRLEWSDDAAHFAEEIFKLFTHREHQEQKAG